MEKKLKKAKSDMWTGVLSALFACLYFAETFRFILDHSVPISAAVFPRIIAGLVFLCAAAIFFRGLRVYRTIPETARHEAKANAAGSSRNLFHVLEAFLILLGVAVAMRPLGFIVTMTIAMFLMFVLLEKPQKRKYGLYAIFSLTLPTAVFFLFYYCFSYLLPTGVLRLLLARIL